MSTSEEKPKKRRRRSNRKPTEKVQVDSLNHMTSVEFKSIVELSENTKKAIKHQCLTKIQNETLFLGIQGKDLLAKAKTGTGKTIAFLLPMIERLLSIQETKLPTAISGLVLSPTRELAIQIATEARALVAYHPLTVVCFVGGTNVKKDIGRLKKQVDIVVATPGRLNDLLSQGVENIKSRIREVAVLVLDEADRLLDLNFRPFVETIIKCLSVNRQTLLYSATLPDALQSITKIALKDDFVFVDTVEESGPTHARVTQSVMQCPLESHIQVLESVLLEHKKNTKNSKVIVFFPTANMTAYMAGLFTEAKYLVLEMHSRKSQSHRAKMSETFRNKTNIIMFTSDVSARGVDYPDVSLIVQMGLTDREQYIHRLGRTARSGNSGQGLLVLANFEQGMLKDLQDIQLETLHVPAAELTPAFQLAQELPEKLIESANKSYISYLGFYNTNLKRLKMSKEDLVQIAKRYSSSLGLVQPPVLEKRLLGKMNLSRNLFQ